MSQWKPTAAEALGELRRLLGELARDKSKLANLAAVSRSWLQVHRYKDILLDAWAEGRITRSNRRRARAVREMLGELQAAVRELRRRIEADESYADELTRADAAAARTFAQLMRLID